MSSFLSLALQPCLWSCCGVDSWNVAKEARSTTFYSYQACALSAFLTQLWCCFFVKQSKQFTFQHWSLHTSTISPFKALACEKKKISSSTVTLHHASSTHRFQGQQIASPSFWPPRLLQWDESGLPRSHVVTRIYSETGGKDPQNS